eukprot:TRINITY_DN6542_c0_g1_i1.p1 TRINITY_DN6542_c0_g1~~TRINITY_DN6542_c0_g1_i1.p1  ORF type:complete len:313 (-),score=82.40 TRINITY_DN6542_c0_g1_i1:39-977(-)
MLRVLGGLARPALVTAVAKFESVPVRGMATLKEVSNRIRSVKNIAKITKSMQMVAASKLRRAQQKMDQARAYAGGVKGFVERPQSEEEKAAIAMGGGEVAATGAKKHLVVALTSDRGLCGGVNSAVAKQVKALAKKTTDELTIVVVGEKGQASLRRDLGGKVSVSFLELSKQPITFASAAAIADRIVAMNPDSLTLVHNLFKTKIAYDTVLSELKTLKSLEAGKVEFGQYEFDTPVLQNMYEFYLANTIYHGLAENAAVEMASRTMAMDNASRNANDMIERLQLFYNRSRQAVITKELIEIISGAAAATESK